MNAPAKPIDPTREAFAEAWQGWVQMILIEHADDPALIAKLAKKAVPITGG